MASEAQIAANRRNARRSTGPKTAGGKARVAQNAIRHGLASTVRLQGVAGERVKQLVDAFLGNRHRSEASEDAALRAAQAQFVLEQTRHARVVLLNEGATALPPTISAAARRSREKAKRLVKKVPPEVMGRHRKQRFLDLFEQQEALDAPIDTRTEHERQGVRLDQKAERLLRLERYERRALSQRKRALADLEQDDERGAATVKGGAR